MANDKIVLLTFPADQDDILRDYIEWHLNLGVDLIIAQDVSSSDNTHEILNSFANREQLRWFPTPEHYLTPEPNPLKYRASEVMAKMARDQYGADWIIMSDVDEFLCPQGDDLRANLQRAAANDVTAISIPCFNMTGPALESARRATETQTLRIDLPVIETLEQQLSGDLPVPYIFIRHPPKTIARASALVEYGPGAHHVTTAQGKTEQFPELRFLHYPVRGFDKFQTKITNVTAFFERNTDLEGRFGWHWRRWIRLNEEGRLRADYENQFVTPARAEELIRKGICTVDETVANWVKNKS